MVRQHACTASSIDGRMKFLSWSPHVDALQQAKSTGALAQVEHALRRAYDATAMAEKGRLRPSAVVENELKALGWSKTYVWAPEGLPRTTGDSFDGWKVFGHEQSERVGIAVEVEWNWQRVYFDLLKFWRASAGGQAQLGIEVLRGPDSFDYAVNHQYVLYRDLFPDLRIVFCALDAEDLREPDFTRRRLGKRLFAMPT